MRTSRIWLAVCFSSAALACAGGDPTPDAGDPTPDAGGPPDAGLPPDAGTDGGSGGGGDGGSVPDPFQITIRVDSAQVTLQQGTTAEIAVQLIYDRSRAKAIQLGVTGAGTGLTATADPSTADGRFSPVLRLTAANTAPTGLQTVKLTASANDHTSDLTFQVTITANANLAGVVIDQNGQPLSSVVARVTDASGSKNAITDLEGRFFVTNVTPPYDLDLADGASKRAYRFAGLTRRDPRLQLGGMRAVPNAWAVEGKLAGAVQLTGDTKLWLGLAANRAHAEGKPVPLTSRNFANTRFTFFGQGATSGTLWALLGRVDPVTGGISSFDGYGEAPVAVVAGQRKADQTISVSELRTGAVTSTLSAPAGYHLSGTRAWLSLTRSSGLWITPKLSGDPDTDYVTDDHAAARDVYDAPQSGAFNYVVPLAPDARVTVSAAAGDGQCSNDASAGCLTDLDCGAGNQCSGVRHVSIARLANIPPDTTAPAMALPKAPEIGAPASEASVPAQADFAWTDDATDRVYVATWGSGLSDEPLVALVTREKHAAAPDLSTLGVALPAGTPLWFRVVAVAPYASVDEAAGTRGLRYDYVLPTKSGRGDDRDGTLAVASVPFTFTAP